MQSGSGLAQFDDIHPDRVQLLNDSPVNQEANYVLYWMQHSQRTEWNHALEYAVRVANDLDKGLVVGFGLMADYPDGNERHFQFMLEGLREVQSDLSDRDIKFVMRFGNPAEVCLDLSTGACLVVCDRGYLSIHRAWRKKVAKKASVRVIRVESDLVVPVESASDKQEYAARTIRKKLTGQYEEYLQRPAHRSAKKSSKSYAIDKLEFTSVGDLLHQLSIDRSVPAVKEFTGGTAAAKERFDRFLDEGLPEYEDQRSDPLRQRVSFMSPYLHFGQVSPGYLLHKLREKPATDDRESYVEELLVRRELTHNFVFYNDEYDRYNCLPEWARESLEKHANDERERVYTREELENAKTDDEYWNAAMQQIKQRGYLHNHMRMYWGKQIIRFTNTPRYAYQTALYLNNKYFLDGRDANSYANVAWLFGLHDQGWKERPVFGKVRIMTPGGLERKTKPEAFIDMVKDYEASTGAP